MEKLTLEELRSNENWEQAVIVFTKDSFNQEYCLKERSYEVTRDNHYFNSGAISNSLFGNCLDGKDNNVRLDLYINDGWTVEYCYINK